MHRMGIWLIALALVFNGVATYAWDDPSGPAATMVQMHDGGIAVVACNVTSDGLAAVVAGGGEHQGGAHNHLKCCATCTVPSVIPAVTAIPVTFAYQAAVFYTAQPHLVGHSVALDPGIPKSIV